MRHQFSARAWGFAGARAFALPFSSRVFSLLSGCSGAMGASDAGSNGALSLKGRDGDVVMIVEAIIT
jgi:hypothetical protein